MSHHAPLAPILYSFPDSTELVDSVAEFVLKAQNDAIKRRGAFTLAISGGSLPGNLKGLIGKEGVLFDKWCVFYSKASSEVVNFGGWAGKRIGVVPVFDGGRNSRACALTKGLIHTSLGSRS